MRKYYDQPVVLLPPTQPASRPHTEMQSADDVSVPVSKALVQVLLMRQSLSCSGLAVQGLLAHGLNRTKVRTWISVRTWETYFRRFETSASSRPNIRASVDSTILWILE